jgi:hypothetical protein
VTVLGVEALGLRLGDRVRFKPLGGGPRQWSEGVVVGMEKDGSVAVRDKKGAWRAVRAERLEARRIRRRGGQAWESVAERAARIEQLALW